jgi:Tfp pilus assembly protein PilV
MKLKIAKLKIENSKRGFSLAEAVISAAILSGFIIVLSQVNTKYLSYALGQSNIIRANFLAEESLEAARFMRDYSYASKISSLTSGANYYLYWSGSDWSATTSPQNTAPFIRTISFANVNRDSSDNIAVSGTLDSGTKLVTASVAWLDKGATTTKTVETIITNVFSN